MSPCAHGRGILCTALTRPKLVFAGLAVALSIAASGCGKEIQVAENDPMRRGAELFNQRCSGCHTFDAANAYGSKPTGQRASGERTNGPNFNTRSEPVNDVLYAIRNGGFSGSIMPANIVVGEDADAVAEFLSEYAGRGEGSSEGTGGSDAGSGAVGN